MSFLKVFQMVFPGCRVAFKKVACAVAVHCCLMNGCVALKDFESAFAQKGCCQKFK